MKLTKIEPKFIKDHNPRIGLITLASDFRIEKDFNDVIHGKDIDLYCNRIHCYNPLTNETLKKMADDIPKVTADILPDQKLDCVAYGCTSGTIAAGYSSIFEKVNSAKPNTKVTTPITSAINALKVLKINKLSINFPLITTSLASLGFLRSLLLTIFPRDGSIKFVLTIASRFSVSKNCLLGISLIIRICSLRFELTVRNMVF